MEQSVIASIISGTALGWGMTKRAGSWYRHDVEVITVLRLQKSIYSGQHYLNVAFWLVELGQARAPKDTQCHIRVRLDSLLMDERETIGMLLDAEADTPPLVREERLKELLEGRLKPVLETMSTIAGIRALEAQGVLAHAAIRAEAISIIRA
jgi:hypothetical protein